MTSDQKSAMKGLLLYTGGAMLAIGGTVGLSFLSGLCIGSIGRGGNLVFLLVILLVSVLLPATIGLVMCIFSIPVVLAEEIFDWKLGTCVVLMVLFGLLFLIFPIAFLVKASKCEVRK